MTWDRRVWWADWQPQLAHAAVDEVATAVDGWQAAARAAGIAAADIALTEGAFSAHTEYRRGRKAQAPAVRARHR